MILVDDRAGSRDLVQHPPLSGGLGCLTRLDAADVCFSGNGPDGPVLVGVEVKSVNDLLSSIQSGRLQDTQLPGLVKGYDVRYLLYYGPYRACPDTGALQVGRTWVQKNDPTRFTISWRTYGFGQKRATPYGYLEGFLNSPAFTRLGVLVKHTFDVEEAALWIGCLHRTWTKPWSKHKAMDAFDNSHKLPETIEMEMDPGVYQRARVAAQLPGLGHDRAVAAAKHFTSVVQMVNADAKEWRKVDGIGKTIADAVVAALRR